MRSSDTRAGSAAGDAHTVVHITTVHPPDDIRIFIKECRTLAAAGYRVHLIAPGAGHDERDGVQMHDLSGARGGRLGRITATAARAYRMAKELNAEIYHLHDPELLLLAPLLLRTGAKVIYDVHEHLPLLIMTTTWLPARLRPLIARMAGPLEVLSARHMSAVVTAGPPVCQRFQLAVRQHVSVYNYALPDDFAESSSTELVRRRAVCYVGVITEARAAHQMVQAAARAGVVLLLAGHFSPPTLMDELRSEPGWSQVRYQGRVGRQQLRAVMGESLAGLCLIRPPGNAYPGQPTKLYEYMWSGIPVIASAFPEWEAIINAYDCGICVDSLDVSAIANAISRLSEHPAEARRLGENGRRAAERLFNWNTEASKLLALYRDLIA